MNDRLWNSQCAVAYGLFVLASVLYIWGLAPTVYWRDSPEFITAVSLQRHFRASAKFVHVESRFCGCKQQGEAAFCTSINPCVRRVCSKSVAVGVYTLGISHPAGSPTYALFAKPITFLPIGSLALRANFFSALCGGLTVSMLFSVLYALLTESLPWVRLCAALSGALALLVSESFWRFAEVAEVYTLQDGLLVVLLTLLVKARQARTCAQPSHIALYWLCAFLYGLSAGVHATMGFFLPAFLVFLGLTAPRMLRGKGLAFRQVS